MKYKKINTYILNDIRNTMYIAHILRIFHRKNCKFTFNILLVFYLQSDIMPRGNFLGLLRLQKVFSQMK